MNKISHLSNGILVVTEQMSYLKSVSIGIFIRAGSANEIRETNGISHLIEHMLFKGTKHFTAKQLAERMEELGGNMNAYTSKEATVFYLTTLDTYLKKAVLLMGEMLCHSLFSPEDLKRELEVIKEEIDMCQDSPEDYVHEALQKEVWRDHPLGYFISGEKEVVSHFTKEQIQAYWRQHYTGENMVISIAGAIEEKEVIPLLEEAFSAIPRGKKIMMREKPVYHKSIVEKEMDLEQIYMNLGFPCISYMSEERYALMLFNVILGGSDNSWLFQRIREEEGLVYSIYSYESLYQLAGLFQIDVAYNPAKKEKVLYEILNVIHAFKKTGFSDEALKRVKEQMKVEWMLGAESSRSQMEHNGRQLFTQGEIVSLESILEKIQKVTKDQIISFAETYLKEENYSISYVGKIK